MEATLSPAVYEPESPKHAFRTAEATLAAVELRNPVPGISAALGRIGECLAEIGIEAPGAAYRRDHAEYRRVAGGAEFPEWLGDADLESVATEAAAYEPPSSPARAKGECTVVPIDERRFTFLIQQTPQFALQVMRTLADRLRSADRRL